MTIHAVTSSLPWNHIQTGAATSSNTAAPGSGASGAGTEPFFAMLQNLQQTAPAAFQQIAAKMADRFQTAAQTAATKGTTALAGALNDASQQLAGAAQSGAMPDMQGVQQELRQAGFLGPGKPSGGTGPAVTGNAGTSVVSGFQNSSNSAIQAMLGGAVDPQSLATQLLMA